MIEIQVVVPVPRNDVMSHDLRTLTRVIHERELADGSAGGLFGGEYGYGSNFENDTFMLHRYCWCEEDTCLWCGGECGCPDPPCEYYLDGKPVTDWRKANAAIVAPLPHEVAEHGTPAYKKASTIFDASIKERDTRLKTYYPKRLHRCKPHGMMADRLRRSTSWQPPQCAPHFWHKRSGSKIWWYKYIGREMKAVIYGTWADVISSCHRSING